MVEQTVIPALLHSLRKQGDRHWYQLGTKLLSTNYRHRYGLGIYLEIIGQCVIVYTSIYSSVSIHLADPELTHKIELAIITVPLTSYDHITNRITKPQDTRAHTAHKP